jgi:hypothetical protein
LAPERRCVRDCAPTTILSTFSEFGVLILPRLNRSTVRDSASGPRSCKSQLRQRGSHSRLDRIPWCNIIPQIS